MNLASRETMQARLQEILIIKKKGDLNSAIHKTKQLINDAPGFFDGWMELGLLYRAVGERSQALFAFQTATKLHLDDIQVWIYIVEENISLRQLDEAIKNLDHIFDIHPDHRLALLRLGEIYKLQDQRLKAMECFQKVLEIEPNHLWANILVAVEYRDADNFLNAEQQLLKVLDMHPNNFPVLKELAKTYQSQNRLEDALLFYERAAKENPDSVWTHFQIAEIYHQLNQPNAVETILESLVESHSDDYNFLMACGRLERQRNRRKKALHWFQVATEKAPTLEKERVAQLLSIEELLALGDFDESLQAVETLAKWRPNHISDKISLGTILQRLSHFTDAILIFQEVLDCDSENTYVYLCLAQSLDADSRTDEAIALLKNAPFSVYETAKVQNQLGHLYRYQNNRTQAIDCFQKALAIDPTHLWANIRLAGELRDLGELNSAKQQLLDALTHHPDHLTLLLELGETEKTQNHIEAAITFYQKADKLYGDRPEPKLKTVQALMTANQLAQATSILHQLLEQYPSDHRVLMQWGYIERQRGHRETSLNWFQQASDIAANPSQRRIAQLFAIDELQELGRLEEAYYSVEELLEQSPRDVDIKMRLGKILQSQPDLTAATNLYTDVLEETPNHLQARIELARTLSQSSQMSNAIKLLTETYDLLGPTPQLLMLLGELAIAQDDWVTAQQWYEDAYQRYPFNPHCPIALANVMVLQGKRDKGFALLKQAEQNLPHVADIPLKIAQIHGQLGELDEGVQILQQLQIRFPDHVPSRLALAQIYGQAGEFDQAQMLLDGITSDRVIWKKQIEHLRGEIALQHYAYETAEYHFQNALTHAPTLNERDRLAITLMAMGKLDEASSQLKLATEELELKAAPSAASIPLVHHVAKVIQSFRIAPDLLAQLKTIQEESKEDQLLALGQLMIQDPYYIGSAITLAKELRHQGIFTQLRDILPTVSLGLPSIPRCIVQYWDAPEPPKDVQILNQTWQDQNPDYEYHRFSYQDALGFIDQYYSNDDRILKAFQNCDQPATQADFFRLAYLNKKGGFYADADDRCRRSLDILLERNPELVLLQEDFACIGNNFMGCIPGQATVRIAFYQAVQNLLHYSADGPWFQTGPCSDHLCLGQYLVTLLELSRLSSMATPLGTESNRIEVYHHSTYCFAL